jgi:hypothetical protein
VVVDEMSTVIFGFVLSTIGIVNTEVWSVVITGTSVEISAFSFFIFAVTFKTLTFLDKDYFFQSFSLVFVIAVDDS